MPVVMREMEFNSHESLTKRGEAGFHCKDHVTYMPKENLIDILNIVVMLFTVVIERTHIIYSF